MFGDARITYLFDKYSPASGGGLSPDQKLWIQWRHDPDPMHQQMERVEFKTIGLILVKRRYGMHALTATNNRALHAGALPRGGLGWTRPPHFFPKVFL